MERGRSCELRLPLQSSTGQAQGAEGHGKGRVWAHKMHGQTPVEVGNEGGEGTKETTGRQDGDGSGAKRAPGWAEVTMKQPAGVWGVGGWGMTRPRGRRGHLTPQAARAACGCLSLPPRGARSDGRHATRRGTARGRPRYFPAPPRGPSPAARCKSGPPQGRISAVLTLLTPIQST